MDKIMNDKWDVHKDKQTRNKRQKNRQTYRYKNRHSKQQTDKKIEILYGKVKDLNG